MSAALVLFPCNGNAVEALDCLGHEYRAIGFVDDEPAKVGATVLGRPVWSRDALGKHLDAAVLAVPGSPRSFHRRAHDIASLAVPRARFATVIHPSAVVSRYATIGANVLIMAGAVVTARAVIEDHVIVLPNSVVHHDARIGGYTMIGAGVVVAGSVQIGEECYVGSGSRIRDHVTVAPRTLVGMGAVVVKSIEQPGGIWAGGPARLWRAASAESPGASNALGEERAR